MTATEATTIGRLFVVDSDLNGLRCDAVLVPVDAWAGQSGSFSELLPDGWADSIPPLRVLSDVVDDGPARTWSVVRLDGPTEPVVFLGNIGGIGTTVEPFLDVVAAFVAESVAALAAPTVGGASPRRLRLALPVVGTQHGGLSHDKGSLVQALVDHLTALAEEHGVDIVLVTHGRRPYAAAQRARLRNRHGDGRRSGLAPQLEAVAQKLADLSRNGRLVVFAGAGVSASAGLPDWQGLLDELARSAQGTPIDLDRLHELDIRDQAQILTRRYGAEFGPRMEELLGQEKFGLLHALLTSLDPDEIVTTNYDLLLERSFPNERPRTVLPTGSVDASGRWLLKLHGSLDDVSRIVLTRDDYLGLAESAGALFGVVQTMLLTKHMLFVGYSLKDDTFHRVMHQVRRARENTIPSGMGTAITLHDDPLLGDLWGDDLDIVPTGSLDDMAAAARTVEVLLDEVALLAADVSHFLLDDSYSSMLDDHERAVKKAVVDLLGVLDPDEPISENLLRRLGMLPTDG